MNTYKYLRLLVLVLLLNLFSLSSLAQANVATPATIPQDLAGKVILLNPGHGGQDTGAIRNGIMEKDITLAISLQLRDLLEAHGAKVSMTRTTDVYLRLPEIANITNRVRPDLFVAVHVNACGARAVDRIETYYWTQEGQEAARTIFTALTRQLGKDGLPASKHQLYVLDHTDIPATLVEVGFLSNPKTRASLVTSSYQRRIADAIAVGITDYFTDRIVATR
jgi:N-acetylmuramoyl-L-alanine amidase